MAKKRLNHARFEAVVLRVLERFSEESTGEVRENLFSDITNKREDFAAWFHQASGIKRSGKYHHEEILSPIKNKKGTEKFVETPAAKGLLEAYIELGGGKLLADGSADYTHYEYKEPAPKLAWFVAGALLLVAAVLGLLLMIPQAEWQAGQIKPNGSMEPEVMGVLHAFQFFLMLLFTVAAFFMEHERLRRLPKGKQDLLRKTFSQLFLGLKGVWGAFCLLYLWLTLSTFLFPDLPFTQAIADFLNALASAFFFYLFLVMDQESFPPRDQVGSVRKFRLFLGWGLVLIAFVVALSMVDRAIEFTKADSIFSVGYSFVMAVPYVYFFGRLDSHNFKANRLALAPLYLYGIIQSIWADLLSGEIQSVVFIAVLVLKVYFYGFVWFHLREGNFQSYFAKMHELYRR